MTLETAIAVAEATAAARRTGLLDALEAGPATAEALAARLGLVARPVALLLDLLAEAGVVARVGDAFALGPQLLDLQRGPAGGLERVMALWAGCEPMLRSGRSPAHVPAEPEARARVYRQAVRGLAEMFGRPAEALAAHLAGRSSANGRVLDVGAGSAVWSLAMAAREPALRVTALDLPEVLPRAAERAAALGLTARFDTLAGDFHAVELPSEVFDRIVLANVLHLETAEGAAALVARLAPALRPDGVLVVVDSCSDGTPEMDLAAAMYALHLALRTGHGRPWPDAELRRWLTDAGLGRVERVFLSGAWPLAAWVAARG